MSETAVKKTPTPRRPQRDPATRRGKRLKYYSHSELCEKIHVGRLIERLTKNAEAVDELMTASQVRSAEILLKKVIPDLKSVEVKGEGGGPVQHTVSVTFCVGGDK